MATDTIRRLLVTPPIAIARLGGSTTPMDAFDWTTGDPHTIAETRIGPAWTLDVDAEGNLAPRMPVDLPLRDGPRVRPVAPFLELWALTGDGPAEGWTAQPVTPALLAANGTDPAQLTFGVTAINAKAARRTRNPDLRFGTFPSVVVRGDQHQAVPLRGRSPPEASTPMIPAGRFIPLGTVQVMRPAPQPADAEWSAAVRVDVVRLRYTPATGLSYGPPQATQSAVPAVGDDEAFLDPAAGWFDSGHGDRAIPADTIDEQDGPPETDPGTRPSLGVVDDTCDVRVVATLTVGGDTLQAHANVLVGPPHFAPDRRPFLSLADEINDRQHDPARDEAMSPEERGRWVEDLFERIYETTALMDVDFHRLSGRLNRILTDAELRPTSIPDDGAPVDNAALGGRDRLRDPDIVIPEPSQIEPRPVAARARERHRTLSDLSALIPFVLAHPDRLRELVRPPFEVSETDPPGRSMQMPPFMLNSNARILNLARWQYDLLMAWADELVAGPGAFAPAAAALSPEAEDRRRQVLALIDDAGDR